MVILENIDIDKAILQNIDIDKISNRFKFGISNRASFTMQSLLSFTFGMFCVFLIEIRASSMCKCLYIQAITMTRVINNAHIEDEE